MKPHVQESKNGSGPIYAAGNKRRETNLSFFFSHVYDHTKSEEYLHSQRLNPQSLRALGPKMTPTLANSSLTESHGRASS